MTNKPYQKFSPSELRLRATSVKRVVADSSSQVVNKWVRLYETCNSEGQRNNLFNKCLYNLKKAETDQIITTSQYLQGKLRLVAAVQVSGLPEEEIQSVINSVESSIGIKSNRVSNPIKQSSYIILDDLPINLNPRLVNYYTPVFTTGKTLKGEDRVLTYEECLLFAGLKHVAENLKHTNRVVIDCDSSETFKLFEHLIDTTECYIGSDRDTLHLVFTTDKLIPTKHRSNIDLLGNATNSLRNIKPNKTSNGLQATPLTQDILDIFNTIGNKV